VWWTEDITIDHTLTEGFPFGAWIVIFFFQFLDIVEAETRSEN